MHNDLAGPIQPLGKEGYGYLLNFIDDYSGLMMLYFLKHKSDTLLNTKKYLADIAPYGHVKCLRRDNGTEFTSETFQQLLVDNQIIHQKLAPYSPHQNGTVERSWRTLFSMVRCLLIESKLPKNLFNHTKFCTITCGPLYVHSKCQSNIHHFIVDSLIASKTEADLMKIKIKLNSRFKMTDLEKLSWFLGIQFECKNNTIKMNPSRYIKDIIKFWHVKWI